jgi:hypothetical protein
MIRQFVKITRSAQIPLQTLKAYRSFSSLTNSYAVPLSQQSSLEDEVNHFFNKMSSNEKEMSLSNLTDFMNRSFIDRHFTFEEHQSYYPLIEELVFYTKQWAD